MKKTYSREEVLELLADAKKTATSSRKTTSALASAPAPRLVGVAAAAAYLSCTVWAIRQLYWDKKIPSIKIGSRLLFDIRDLDAFVERNKEAAR